MYAVAHLLVVIAVEFNQSVGAGGFILIHFTPIVEVHGRIGRNEGVAVRVGVLAPYVHEEVQRLACQGLVIK